jgi:hypothetical protein
MQYSFYLMNYFYENWTFNGATDSCIQVISAKHFPNGLKVQGKGEKNTTNFLVIKMPQIFCQS